MKIQDGKLVVKDGKAACECCVSCDAEIAANPFAFGACCIGNECFTTHPCLCEQANGLFLGKGTSCATDRCDQIGPDGVGDFDDPLVCVHYYESRIICIDGQESNGPVNRAGSQCERCSSTNYPANGPTNVNAGWVRESRREFGLWQDYWVYKYCSRDACGTHLNCALGGLNPVEFGFTSPEPPQPPQFQKPPEPFDYCFQFGAQQGATPAQYTPLFPNGPDGLRVTLSRATGCGSCNQKGEDLEL